MSVGQSASSGRVIPITTPATPRLLSIESGPAYGQRARYSRWQPLPRHKVDRALTENSLTDERLEQLLEVGRAIVSELDPETVLRRVLDAAGDLTGARYAALGVLNEDKTGLERFLHSGIDEETRREIGPLPRGRGVLGELIRDPRPCASRTSRRTRARTGFPPAHPEMKTFLGTPVLVRGEAWGNLYLTEKEGGAEFDETDEQVAIVLAAWSGVAIENARLYEGLDQRAEELQRALRGLEAASDVARTVSKGIGLEELLDLIVKRGRGVVGAQRAMVLLSNGSELEVVAAAGRTLSRWSAAGHPTATPGSTTFRRRYPTSVGWRRSSRRSSCADAHEVCSWRSVRAVPSTMRTSVSSARLPPARRRRSSPCWRSRPRSSSSRSRPPRRAAPLGAGAPRRDASGARRPQGHAGVLGRPRALGALGRVAQDRHRARRPRDSESSGPDHGAAPGGPGRSRYRSGHRGTGPADGRAIWRRDRRRRRSPPRARRGAPVSRASWKQRSTGLFRRPPTTRSSMPILSGSR